MKITIKIFLFFALFADYSMTWNRQESTAARNLYKIVRNVVFKKIGRTGTRPGLLRAARQHVSFFLEKEKKRKVKEENFVC